jgi:hypothetical protein
VFEAAEKGEAVGVAGGIENGKRRNEAVETDGSGRGGRGR